MSLAPRPPRPGIGCGIRMTWPCPRPSMETTRLGPFGPFWAVRAAGSLVALIELLSKAWQMRANGCIDDRGAGCFSTPGFLEILFLKIQGSDSALFWQSWKLQFETESRTFLFYSFLQRPPWLPLHVLGSQLEPNVVLGNHDWATSPAFLSKTQLGSRVRPRDIEAGRLCFVFCSFWHSIQGKCYRPSKLGSIFCGHEG